MLAPWVGRRTQTQAAALEADLDRIPDSIHTAPGWRLVDEDFHTLVQPVGGPVHDPAVVKAVHSFDPGAIPMWRKQRYWPPNSTTTVTVSHLAFGRRVRFPRRELALFSVEMPPRCPYPTPNELLMIWEFFDNCLFYEGGPGGVFPSDMRIYDYMRADYLKGDTKAGERLSEREREINAHKTSVRKARADEMTYRQKRLDAYVSRQLEMPGDTVRAFHEWKLKRRAAALQRRLRGAN